MRSLGATAIRALAVASAAAAQCYNPCAQYKRTQQFQSCCAHNASTPACEGKPCPPPPPTCAQKYQGVLEPTLGQDMQACCTADPSNCGPVNPDYSVFQNVAACGASAPPTLGNYAYGKFKPYTGGDTTSIQVYIDPALDSYKFPDGSISAGAVQDIENALNAAASQLGLKLTYSSSPLAADTGYTVWLGDGNRGDLCAKGDAECTEDFPRPSTSYATTWVEFANWGSPGTAAILAQEVEQTARHEFGHSDGLADDYAVPSSGSCLGKTAMWYSPMEDGLQPGPYPSVDVCAHQNDGAGGGGEAVAAGAAEPGRPVA